MPPIVRLLLRPCKSIRAGPWQRVRNVTDSVGCEGDQAMTRYGAQFGPDITFLGVDPVDVADTAALREADVVVVGAPWDGGTSHRPGTRFGPSTIRGTDYLPHD